MKLKNQSGSFFPHYLKPGPDQELLKWVGGFLQKRRQKMKAAQSAKIAGITIDQLNKIEQGTIHCNLGTFRQILKLAYGCSLEDVMAECFGAFKDRFNSKGSSPFERDFHYTFSLPNKDGKFSTPILIGGDGVRFLWAAPMRRLRNQPLCMDFLELAPHRKKMVHGISKDEHDGTEIVHVMKGSVNVEIDGESESNYNRTLTAGESIHYRSRSSHRITNAGSVTPALLLIIRMPTMT